jgi:hypothetical protein
MRSAVRLIVAIGAWTAFCGVRWPEAHQAARHGGGHALKPPYVEKIGRRDGITVWAVDGAYIRTNSDIEFTNYGQHYTFPYIPEDEFWIDREGKRDETEFFVLHMSIEHRLMGAGVPYDEALDSADAAERMERRRSGDIGRLTQGGNLPDARKVRLHLWKKLAGGVSVWIIDGRLVRSVFDVDFTEGGHEHVYEFIPENDVWIDNDLQQAERGYVLLHELHERNLMAAGWEYDRAHEESSALELRCRRNPEELHPALAKEGWE